MKTVYTVKINYKSGISQVVDFLDFKIVVQSNGTKKFDWVSYKPKEEQILMMGVDNVESVYQLGFREVED